MSKDDMGVGFPAPPLDQKPAYDELVTALRRINEVITDDNSQEGLMFISYLATELLKRIDA